MATKMVFRWYGRPVSFNLTWDFSSHLVSELKEGRLPNLKIINIIDSLCTNSAPKERSEPLEY